MHFGDSIFIFIMALVLFGPKKLPEIGRQVGKLLAEFRRASNEFKFQIQEEIRNMEEDERRKKLAESPALQAATKPAEAATPTILPPSTGAPVSAARPFVSPVEAVEPLPVSPDLALSSAEIVPEPQPFADNGAITETSHAAAASEPAAAHLAADATTHGNGSHPLTGEISESVHHD